MSVLIAKNSFSETENQEMVENLVIDVPTLSIEHSGDDAQTIFKNMPQLEGVVVLDNETPVGLIMRPFFYQKIGTLYGHSLYITRKLSILMDTSILIVDSTQSIPEVVRLAMERDHDRLYDYIVVTREDKYVGVINIKMFLTELTKHREQHIAVLKTQHEDLQKANQEEKRLLADLEQKAAAEKNLLDNAGQGFMSFSVNLITKNEYSAECRKIFCKEIGNQFFPELMSMYLDPEKIDVCKKVLKSYFNNQSKLKDIAYLTLLPTECIINKKNVRLEYKRIESSTEKMVMVILTDVTDQKLLEKRMEEERYNQHLIIKAVTYQDQIKQLMEDLFNYISHEYKDSFSENINPSDSVNEVYRVVHTFKGDFSQFGFLSTATNLHKIEDKLSYLIASEVNLSLETIQSIFDSVKYNDIINNDLKILHTTFGEDYFQKIDFIEVANSRLEQVINKVISFDKSTQNNQIIDLIKGLKRKNLRDYLKQFDDYLHYLADRLQKNHPNYSILSDDIYVDIDQYRGVIKSLGHLYRNMLDHGIESDEERVVLGKSAEGNISCEMMISNGIITISIADDGRGIDLNKVKQKAIDCKIATPEEIELMSENDILNFIFIDCFSTNECTTLLSGRGVGMSAVKYECEKIGGKIGISTQSGKGTKYTIELPKLV